MKPTLNKEQDLVIKTIRDVIRNEFSDNIVVTAIITDSSLTNEQKDSIDTNCVSIAAAQKVIDKYIQTFTDANIPNESRKAVKGYYVFFDSNIYDATNKDTANKELLKYVAKSDILVICASLSEMSDYALYYKMLDMLEKNRKKMKKTMCGNIIVAKNKDIVLLPLQLERLSSLMTLPKNSIMLWSGNDSSTFHANISGMEEMSDKNTMKFSDQFDGCIENTSDVLFKFLNIKKQKGK
jgi:hypothetical protein